MSQDKNNNSSQRVLVIGFGSIGSRHATVFKEQGASVAVLSKRNVNWQDCFKDLKTALVQFKPNIVIVCCKTSEHKGAIDDLIGNDYSGVLVVEKPLFDKYYQFDSHQFKKLVVGYNLRKHPFLEVMV